MNTYPSCMEFLSEPESDFGGLGTGLIGEIETGPPLRMRDGKRTRSAQTSKARAEF